MVTFEMIKQNKEIAQYLQKGNDLMRTMGITDHSATHTMIVAHTAHRILRELGYDDRTCELVQIAGYMHDIGNMINRYQHEQNGAILAFQLLSQMEMEMDEVATVVSAIANHDEEIGMPVSPVSAAIILADKLDMRASRVQAGRPEDFDVHDNINFAVTQLQITIDPVEKIIRCDMTYDTSIVDLLSFFEHYTNRLKICIRAAQFLGTVFQLTINGTIIV